MLNRLKRYWMKKRLKDPHYTFLFETPSKDEVVVFDTETTGLNTKEDEIVSIGAVKVKGNRILTSSALHLYVQCERNISPESIKIHQIRACDMQNCIKPEEAIATFLDFIGPRPLVGYYLEFDVAMVNRWVKPILGITLPNQLIEISSLYYDKKVGKIPKGHVDLRFETILKTLDIPNFGQHDALNDAIMTAIMYVKLKTLNQI
ncbi:MAG: 3'-5' exonuclease [Hydrogenimonas sp.]|nr:MAG: 3'-5' exonuclease [Hydrogenimonas sp.]